MGSKEIESFDTLMQIKLLPFLKEYGFQFLHKTILENIGSYEVVFNKNEKNIILSFCMHHYDLFDGISLKLQDKSSKIEIFLNNLSNEKRKIFSQLKPENALIEIVNDLKTYCNDFLLS